MTKFEKLKAQAKSMQRSHTHISLSAKEILELVNVVDAARKIPNCKFEEAKILVWKLEDALEILDKEA